MYVSVGVCEGECVCVYEVRYTFLRCGVIVVLCSAVNRRLCRATRLYMCLRLNVLVSNTIQYDRATILSSHNSTIEISKGNYMAMCNSHVSGIYLSMR